MSPNMIRISSGGFDFDFEQQELKKLIALNSADDTFTILKDNDVISGKIVFLNQRNYQVEINGENFEVKIKSELDTLIENMGIDKPKTQKIKSLKAPMPGLVIEISVSEGQNINENEKVLILEAMKMENVLKIPHEATIKKVCIEKGQAVEKGQVLLELE